MSSRRRSRLIVLALSYIEPRHRLSLLSEALQERILRARKSLRRFLPSNLAQRIEFYDPARLMKSATIRDNLIFGRVRFGKANAEQQVDKLIRATMIDLGLDGALYSLGLDSEVGISGRAMHTHQRAAINIARGLIKRPSLCIVDGALAAFSAADATHIVARLREHFAGRSLVVTLNDPAEAEAFDRVMAFEGARMVSDQAGAPQASEAAVAAPGPSASLPLVAAEARQADLSLAAQGQLHDT